VFISPSVVFARVSCVCVRVSLIIARALWIIDLF
jgi:hypothetical protein